MATELKSIEEELADCRARCADSAVGTWYHLIHHWIHFEPLTAPAEERIQGILTGKSEWQRAARLRHMGPWTGPLPAVVREAWDRALAKLDLALEAGAAWEATPEFAEQHARLFPDCPWDGKTMFPTVP